MRELGQQIDGCREGGVLGGLWPIQQEEGTQVLEGNRRRCESANKVEVG
jgi:hypothetical protein